MKNTDPTSILETIKVAWHTSQYTDIYPLLEDFDFIHANQEDVNSVSGALIDYGNKFGIYDVTKLGIYNLLLIYRNSKYSMYYPPTFYNIANGYYSMFHSFIDKTVQIESYKKTLRRAIRYFRKTKFAKPNTSEIYINLGNLYSDIGRYVISYQCYRTAISNDDHPMAWLNMARLYYTLLTTLNCSVGFPNLGNKHKQALEKFILLAKDTVYSVHIQEAKYRLDHLPYFSNSCSRCNEYAKAKTSHLLKTIVLSPCVFCEACIDTFDKPYEWSIDINALDDIKRKAYIELTETHIENYALLTECIDVNDNLIDCIKSKIIMSIVFRNWYSLLDKVMYYLVKTYEIKSEKYKETHDEQIYFHRAEMWERQGKIKREFQSANSLSFLGLYDIYLDIIVEKSGYDKMRNALEHRIVLSSFPALRLFNSVLTAGQVTTDILLCFVSLILSKDKTGVAM